MSRKNNRAKYARMISHYKQDEKDRAEKLKRRNDARLKTVADRERSAAMQRGPIAKKPKAMPVVAMDKNAKKMQRMLKKMDLAGSGTSKKMMDDDSSSDDD